MVYPLVDLKRAGLHIRGLVTALERSVIDLASEFGLDAVGRREAPGVYVDGRKLASIGLRVRRGASYHGMALNVAVDLEPFSRINPCGFAGLQMTDLSRLGVPDGLPSIAARLERHLLRRLNRAD
jgi:lipoyl(octanoyl) transferase